MDDREGLAGSRFSCGERDRALFEAGIKMGTIYHQFVGTPVSSATVEELERAISSSIRVQPYVEDAVVRIDRRSIPDGDGTYEYASRTGDMIDAVVSVRVGGTRVVAEMRYDPELDYPLMYVSSVERGRLTAYARWITHPVCCFSTMN